MNDDAHVPFDRDGVTDAERISYIQEGLAELRSTSLKIQGGGVLTYFIEMAMMEAADQARRILHRK